MTTTSTKRVITGALLAAILAGCGSDGSASDADGPSPRGTSTASAGPAAAPPLAVTTTAPGTTTTPPPPAPPPPPPTTVLPPVPRVLLVGDSTLLSVGEYRTHDALQGMDADYRAASCRALAQRSCGDDPPANSVTTINRAAGPFDVVVIMAGYDEWYTTFSSSFDRVVESARAKGAQRVVWLTYPEGVDYRLPDDRRANVSLVNMNRILREKVDSGAFPDVVIADWYGYSQGTQGWYTRDDIHITKTGAYAVADYISRKIAAIGGAPCPMPREPGHQVEAPCPDPDLTGPVPDVVALYTT